MAKFKLLYAILEVMVNLTLAQVKEKFLCWENKMEIESSDIACRQVVLFTGSGSHNNQKHKNVKKVKSARDVDQAFASVHGSSNSNSGVICYDCGVAGHFRNECPARNALKSQSSLRRQAESLILA